MCYGQVWVGEGLQFCCRKRKTPQHKANSYTEFPCSCIQASTEIQENHGVPIWPSGSSKAPVSLMWVVGLHTQLQLLISASTQCSDSLCHWVPATHMGSSWLQTSSFPHLQLLSYRGHLVNEWVDEISCLSNDLKTKLDSLSKACEWLI